MKPGPAGPSDDGPGHKSRISTTRMILRGATSFKNEKKRLLNRNCPKPGPGDLYIGRDVFRSMRALFCAVFRVPCAPKPPEVALKPVYW